MLIIIIAALKEYFSLFIKKNGSNIIETAVKKVPEAKKVIITIRNVVCSEITFETSEYMY
jgi:hypothetical protein